MLSKQAYRGSRYSFGYPACPYVEDQDKVQDLIEWERIGVHLSEESMHVPQQSTAAQVDHHPQAKYFAAR
jgi:5-methyltetrahydrofolate--homocysteine methyltransferase